MYFSAHCAGVTNMPPHYNLSPAGPAVKKYTGSVDIGVRDLAATAKRTTDLVKVKLRMWTVEVLSALNAILPIRVGGQSGDLSSQWVVESGNNLVISFDHTTPVWCPFM